MSTAKTTKTKTVAEKLICVADVARELGLDPKTARAFLRRHADLYAARKKTFPKNSKLHTATRDALKTIVPAKS